MMSKVLSLCLLLTTISCSTLSYITEQGLGQWKIQRSGVPIAEYLKQLPAQDPRRHKIQLVQQAKQHFIKHFFANPKNPSTPLSRENQKIKEKLELIYDQVVELNQDAVTYLVVASSFKEVKALEHRFWFVGSFPNLGFFKLDSARKKAKQLEDEQYFTSLRPVLAYSSLGRFEDRLLSSFFLMDDLSLVETIYHELVHLYFFAKDEVAFNENLANFAAKLLLQESPFLMPLEVKAYQEQEEWSRLQTQRVVELIGQYQLLLKRQLPSDKKTAQELLKKFQLEVFDPQMAAFCREQGKPVGNCRYLGKSWNHASMAHLLTYEKDSQYWEHWWQVKGREQFPSVKEFLARIKSYYAQYLERPADRKEKTFEQYVQQQFKE